MNEEIKLGDTVMVVRGMPCCGFASRGSLGRIFIVDEIASMSDRRIPDNSVCAGCFQVVPLHTPIAISFLNASMYLLSRLKKLPPLADEEIRTELKEEVTQ